MFPDPLVIDTIDLRKPGVLDLYKNMGYTYIRQVYKPYNMILRSPSIGCTVQLTIWRDVGSHLINSPKGRKLVSRISYF